VELDSELGRGTTVSIFLPRADPSPARAPNEEEIVFCDQFQSRVGIADQPPNSHGGGLPISRARAPKTLFIPER
jgi:hypothetical protein